MAKQLSESARFSVESLLYYAPKIIRTGEDLATSTTAMRRRLVDLSSFVGSSWWEKPFREKYLAAQQEVLISATGLAYEIQAIGVGIEKMARTYGIAEEQNTADVRRIQQIQEQYPTGRALQPPPAHPEEPPPPPPVPTPQPGKSPNPFARHPPTPSMPHTPPPPTPTPTPHTPTPRAGVNPDEYRKSPDGKKAFGPWGLDGDTALMLEAAGAWTKLTGALDNAWTELKRYTAYILADTQGSAADAFYDYVDGLTATGHGSLTQAIQASQDLHDICLYQAREVENTRRSIEEIVIEAALAIIVDQVISTITAGTAEALNAAIADGLITRILAYLNQFRELGETATEILETEGRLLAKVFIDGGKNVISGEVNTTINNEIGKLFRDKPESESDALKDDETNFAAGFITSLLGNSGDLAAAKALDVSKQLAENGDRAGAQQLIRISHHLADNKSWGQAAIQNYINQVITKGQLTVSPSQLLSGTISTKLSHNL